MNIVEKSGMTLEEGTQKFIQTWGTVGSNWGINRTMAQIHALLLISPDPLSAKNITETLQISTGNANMNIRALIDWGLVYKELKAGDRKEYFVAEKDMGKVIKQVIIERKKRELEPLLKVLEDISAVEATDPASEQFSAVVKDIKLFSHKANTTLDKLVSSKSDWLMGSFLKLIH